jgi:hypothetical protein
MWARVLDSAGSGQDSAAGLYEDVNGTSDFMKVGVAERLSASQDGHSLLDGVKYFLHT